MHPIDRFLRRLVARLIGRPQPRRLRPRYLHPGRPEATAPMTMPDHGARAPLVSTADPAPPLPQTRATTRTPAAPPVGGSSPGLWPEGHSRREVSLAARFSEMLHHKRP